MWLERVELEFSPEGCNGCGICVACCPKDAIALKPVAAWLREKQTPLEFDDEKCVCCGVCAALCQRGALKVRINGEERCLLVENKALPEKLEFEGEIRIDAERCPRGCDACEEVCFEGAIRIGEESLELEEEKCNLCGACLLACPADAIWIERRTLKRPEREAQILRRVEEKLLGRLTREKVGL